MSKVAIAYIGPKPTKKDTITGSRQVFPRMKAIEVDEATAANLLRFPTVFVEAEKLDEVKKAQEAETKAKAEAAELAKAEVAKKAEEVNFTVTVAGTEYDLNKMNCPKIAALLEGADIELEPKGAQEGADIYKLRVRDALRALEAKAKAEAE
ncbi:hypothetical protein DI392_00720 [Vibrio albus]|uniref:Uncharacterized protein n=1 Tax=Vibrio albus TaxID=2200953 RepID=A0A2U3BDI6_9VIBR|nr:hypothetical protein [Vibrio albus]PWI34837.1 hypothetical protein DI392_00720 [Vibrio albus]